MKKPTSSEEKQKKKTSTKFGGGVKKLFKKLRWKKKKTAETKQLQEAASGETNHAPTKKSGRSRTSALRKQRDNAAFYDESTPLVEGQEHDGSSTHTNTSGAIQPEEKIFDKNPRSPSSEDDADVAEDQDEFIPSPLSPRRRGQKKTRFSTVVDSVTINESLPASMRMDSSLRSFLASASDLGDANGSSSRRKVGRLSEKLSKLIDLANLTHTSDDNETPKEKANKLSLMRSLREQSMGLSAGSLSSLTSDNFDDDDSSDNNSKYNNDEIAAEETIADLFVSSIRSSIPYAAPIMNSLSRFSRISVMQSLTRSFYSGSIRTSSVSMLSKTGRTRSSMMKWATQYRYSEGRPVVDEKSHYVARTKWGIWMERILIPWTPSSTESLVTFLLFFSISQTIPMAITRYREGRWKMVYMQQALVNWILKTLFGMEAPFGGYIFGVHYPRDEDNPTRPGIDWVFGLHLAAGIGWILAGSLQ